MHLCGAKDLNRCYLGGFPGISRSKTTAINANSDSALDFVDMRLVLLPLQYDDEVV